MVDEDCVCIEVKKHLFKVSKQKKWVIEDFGNPFFIFTPKRSTFASVINVKQYEMRQIRISILQQKSGETIHRKTT